MRALVLIAVLFLSACGFSPVYGDKSFGNGSSTVAGTLNQIRINPLADREGQFLRNALIDRFYGDGYPTNPLYALTVSPIKEQETAFDITVESEATRYQLKISTSIQLKDLNTGELILTRSLNGISSYNVLESEFATRVSEQNAREAVLNDLARQIEQHIALTLNK
ncbi:MAG: LPS assembly lipoprotein LptE [Pseudomonadota bacterium]